MSSQTKLIKDILSTYDTILENRNLSEATDVYDNVDFKDNVVGKSKPSKDKINVALLQDIQTAAKNAGVKVDITTAVSGHESLPSRHPSGNAVDISIINGKPVSKTNRRYADKLVDELVKMGYTKNAEGSSNPKAVLTFGFKGHDNHVHVSNTTSSPTTVKTNGDNNTNNNTNNNEPYITGDFRKQFGLELLKAIGIKEERVFSSFGKNYNVNYGEVIIPKKDNKKIKSPVSGIITYQSVSSSNCTNPLTIKFKIDGDTFYLQYCGLNSISVRTGENISKGDVLGLSDSDIRVRLYTHGGNKRNINPDLESNSKKNNNDVSNSRSISKPGDGFYYSLYKSAKDNLFKKDKLQENIKRIKGLL